ncbi:hypothetical protein INT47_008294 [Mucor saturninus]|uniref:Uncharacterized protein n=1 Tax=Mucor saturninus TaxID=64648 RepID=A0A8H7V446_9FUNG|nr:hypothetical protein INT47_008294 [Mucor saturninus]
MAPPPKDYWFHIKYWAVIIPLAYIISFLYMFYPLAGIHKLNEDYNIESCEKISGPADFRYCEDVILSTTEPGIAYTTCDPERHLHNKVMGISSLAPGQTAKSGGYWRRPASIEQFQVKDFDTETDFHPLGMTVDTHPETGERLLVSVNLPHYGEASIEFYTIDDANLELKHKRTIRHEKIYNPNSVHVLKDVRFRAADGTPSFFFTNDHYFMTAGLLKKIENYFFYLSNVGFYNARTQEVEKGMNGMLFANGVTGNDQTLFVAETNRRTIKKYQILTHEDEKGVPHITLSYQTQAVFDMAVDNLRFNEEKNLVTVAGHPKGIQAMQYMMAKNKTDATKPPSQVDVWDVTTGETETLIKDNGELFTTSTTGALDFVHSKLVVAALFDEGLLICDI